MRHIPPRLIAVKLPGWEIGGDRRLAIVGKGVCFDSGGISLKPADGMGDMKHDKSGACAVIAAARTVARLAPDTPLMAVAPMVENMPGGNAQRPGDVVKAMNGMTVEVTNTDAEGRLILGDAMTWAERERRDPRRRRRDAHRGRVDRLRRPGQRVLRPTARVGRERSAQPPTPAGSGSGRCRSSPSTAPPTTRRMPTS